MLDVLLEVLSGFGQTFLKLLPYLAVMGVLFGALSWVSPCNAGKPWWRKKGLVTDLTYLFITPVFMRYARIGLAIMIAGYLVGIKTPAELIAYFDPGHGPISRLPFWVQLVGYLVLSDFAHYWI